MYSIQSTLFFALATLATLPATAYGMDMDHGDGGGSSSMTMVFFNAIDTPLFTNAWTPKNVGQYAGTCIFLIVLSIVYRAMTAGKHLIESYWTQRARARRYMIVSGHLREAERVEQANTNPERGGGPDSGQDIAARSEGTFPIERIEPWRLSVDLPRSIMSVGITAVGYFLMLAVMTMNIGYFLSVLAGALLGELFIGRYGSAVDHHHNH